MNVITLIAIVLFVCIAYVAIVGSITNKIFGGVKFTNDNNLYRNIDDIDAEIKFRKEKDKAYAVINEWKKNGIPINEDETWDIFKNIIDILETNIVLAEKRDNTDNVETNMTLVEEGALHMSDIVDALRETSSNGTANHSKKNYVELLKNHYNNILADMTSKYSKKYINTLESYDLENELNVLDEVTKGESQPDGKESPPSPQPTPAPSPPPSTTSSMTSASPTPASSPAPSTTSTMTSASPTPASSPAPSTTSTMTSTSAPTLNPRTPPLNPRTPPLNPRTPTLNPPPLNPRTPRLQLLPPKKYGRLGTYLVDTYSNSKNVRRYKHAIAPQSTHSSNTPTLLYVHNLPPPPLHTNDNIPPPPPLNQNNPSPPLSQPTPTYPSILDDIPGADVNFN